MDIVARGKGVCFSSRRLWEKKKEIYIQFSMQEGAVLAQNLFARKKNDDVNRFLHLISYVM